MDIREKEFRLVSRKSKEKGKSWERDVATHLSQLYGESFIRVPHSGAYIGGKNSARKDFLHEGQIRAMKGDIIPPADWKKFNCECKNYADFPFHQLFQQHIGLLETWLDQLMDVADDGDFNILIFKITRKGKWVAVPAASNILGSRIFNYGSVKHDHWHIIDYDQFWELNSDLVKTLSTT